MKLLISEYSSCFANSTYPLCNELIKYNDLSITYLSDKINPYIGLVSNDITKEQIFDVFATEKAYKKGTIKWLFNRISTSIKNCIRRNNYIREHKPDITLIELTMTSVDCHFIKAIKSYTKIVYTVHDVVVPYQSLSWSMQSLKKMYEIADAMVVHTEANKKQLINEFNVPNNKIHVIPHGIDVKYTKLSKEYCRLRLGITDNNSKILLFYGGIRKSKGLDILLDAIKGLDIILIIAGAVPYGESFEAYRKKIIENKIRTIEYITFTSDDFRDILFQASDYLVLPYRDFSSQSGVLMQSIRYHLPIVATNVGSFEEYIKKYDIGYICDSNNIISLRQAIMDAFCYNKNFEKQMLVVAEEHSWKNSGKKYQSLFFDLLKHM